MATALSALTPEQRRAARKRSERTMLHAIAVAAERLVDDAPGATFATLKTTVIAWREWGRRNKK